MNKFLRIFRPVFQMSFWVAVFMAAMGQLMTFSPGAESGWALMVAAMALPGFLIPSAVYRVFTGVLLVLSLSIAWLGHQRGIDYREWLENHGLPRASSHSRTANPVN